MNSLPTPTFLQRTTSTNLLAMQAANQGCEHGACWVADEQTQGRGRRELGGDVRQWHSPAGVNLYFSIVLRPAIEPQEAANLTLAAAIGATKAIERVVDDVHVRIKWPNDLYCDGRKLAGILTEASFKSMKLDAVVVGMGLNVNMRIEDVPEALQHKVTSLYHLCGHPCDRLALAWQLQAQIVSTCDVVARQGLGAILSDLRQRDDTIGRQVTWLDDGVWKAGTSKGIDDSGHLMIYDSSANRNVHVQAGEVRFASL